MVINLIAAMSRNRAIGRGNRLPWHLPADLRHFKRITLGHTIIMGRRTWESIGSRPLPGRRNVVLTRHVPPDLRAPADENVQVAHNLAEAIGCIAPAEEAFVIGGARVFDQTIAVASRIYLTVVDVDVEAADAFFPDLDACCWETVRQEPHEADAQNPHAYRFLELRRRPQHAVGLTPPPAPGWPGAGRSRAARYPRR